MVVLQYKLDDALRKLDNTRLALSAKVSERAYQSFIVVIVMTCLKMRQAPDALTPLDCSPVYDGIIIIIPVLMFIVLLSW